MEAIYKIYGYNKEWELVRTTKKEKRVEPIIQSLQNYTEILVIKHTNKLNMDEVYYQEYRDKQKVKKRGRK